MVSRCVNGERIGLGSFTGGNGDGGAKTGGGPTSLDCQGHFWCTGTKYFVPVDLSSGSHLFVYDYISAARDHHLPIIIFLTSYTHTHTTLEQNTITSFFLVLPLKQSGFNFQGGHCHDVRSPHIR